MRLTSGRAADRVAGGSPRSLRSAVFAVCVTGVLSIVIPLGLLLGKDGLVTAGVNRQAPVPAAELAGCPDGPPARTDGVRAGQCLRVTGGGFGAGELIEVTEARRAGWHSYLRTDELGRFSWRFLLPANAPSGPDVLTFVGTDRTDPATIPAVAFCRFTVVG